MQLGKYYRTLRNLGPAKNLIELAYFVTPHCNFRCKHCFNWEELKSSKKPHELTSNEISRFAKSLPKLLRLLLTGGEPFLKKNLDEICHLFYKHCDVKHISIPTNASLPVMTANMVKKILQSCPEAYLNISPSLDHIGTKRDEFVEYINSFEIFKMVYNELMELSNDYPNLCINVVTTFNEDNQEDIEDIFHYATEKLKPHSYAVNIVRGIMEGGTRQGNLQIDKYEKIVKMVEDYNAKRKVMNFAGANFFLQVRRAVRDIVIDTFKNDKYYIPCYSGRVRLVMACDGRVFPCETFMFEKPVYCFGNIRDFDYDFKKILGAQYSKKIISSIKNSKCFCHSECDYLYNILFNPRLFFKLFKKTYL